MISRKFAGLAVAFASASALVMSAPTAAHAESANGPSFDEIVYCLVNVSCSTVQDATDWASNTAKWRYPNAKQHNDKADAFRHCIWAGALANRLGYDKAHVQSIGHEQDGDPLDEVLMDVANDLVGLDIGVKSLSEGGKDQWGWIMKECGSLADAHKLYGLGGVQGNN